MMHRDDAGEADGSFNRRSEGSYRLRDDRTAGDDGQEDIGTRDVWLVFLVAVALLLILRSV
jgi:hypothetical protein